MRQFFNILRFEFGGYLKNKVFTGITIAFVIIIGVVLSFPRIGGLFESENTSEPSEKQVVLLSDLVSKDKNMTLLFFQEALTDKKVELTDKSIEELTKGIDSGEYSSAIVITSPTIYTYIVKSIGIYDSTKYIIDEIMLAKYRMEAMEDFGITFERSKELLNTAIESELIQTGKDQANNFLYTYILIFVLYIAILLYGQFVATSVATEKSSRAMELLITSAKPVSLMFGKIIGAGLAGLLQMVAIFGSSFFFYNLNKDYWQGSHMINSLFDMPITILLYSILFFVLGFFMYSFLYGAVGSLASKVEDINTSVMPITMVFIVAFFIVMFSMTGGSVNSTLMKVASYVPFTSPMAMFVRIAMGEVAAIEIVITVLILIVSILGIGYLSAKIYKVGVLLYGKPPKVLEIIRAIGQK